MLRVAHSGLPQYFRGINPQTELVFRRGDRGWVYDTEDNPYVDFVLGFGPVILGHGHPDFEERFARYLSNGLHLPGYTCWHTELMGRLLEGPWSSYPVSFF